MGKIISLATVAVHDEGTGDRARDLTIQDGAEIADIIRDIYNLNPNVIWAMRSSQSRNALLEAAGLLDWAEKLSDKMMTALPEIFQLYWRQFFSAKEYALIAPYVGDDEVVAPVRQRYASPDQGFLRRMKNKLLDKIADMGLTLSRQLNFAGLLAKTYFANPASLTEDTMNRFVLSITNTIRYSLREKLCDPSELVDVASIMLDPKIGLDVAKLPAPVATLFQLGLKAYFPTVSMDLKGRMIGQVIALKPDQSTDNLQLVKAVMMGAGPAMQKLMQLMGAHTKNPELEAFLEDLKADISGMSDRDREFVLEHALGYRADGSAPENWSVDRSGRPKPARGQVFGYKYVNDERVLDRREMVEVRVVNVIKRLSAASIGEGWLARISVDGEEQDVFLKLKRRFVNERMDAEFKFLDKILEQDDTMKPLIDDMKVGLLEELDWEREVGNQIEGAEVFDTSDSDQTSMIGFIGIHVPKPLGLFRAHGPAEFVNAKVVRKELAAVIIMPLESGVTMSKAINTPGMINADNACSILNLHLRFMEKWIAPAIVTGRITHGDPHSGNFLVGFHPVSRYNWLTVLDWGNVVQINSETRAALHEFAVALFARNIERILNVFGMNKNNRHLRSWKQIRYQIEEIFLEIDELSQMRSSRRSIRKKMFNGLRSSLSRYSSSASTPSGSSESIGHTAAFIESQADLESTYGNMVEQFGDSGAETGLVETGAGVEEADSEFDQQSLYEDAQGDIEEFMLPATFILPSVREKVLAKPNWSMFSKSLVLIDTVIMKIGLVKDALIPPGITGFFRARQFLEDTLDKLSQHPSIATAVRKGLCKIPEPADVFVKNIVFTSAYDSSLGKMHGKQMAADWGTLVTGASGAGVKSFKQGTRRVASFVSKGTVAKPPKTRAQKLELLELWEMEDELDRIKKIEQLEIAQQEADMS